VKSYFYAQGGWPEMCRERIGREMRTDRTGGVVIHTGEAYKAIPYGHDNWRPEDRVFEISDPGRFLSRGTQMRVRSMTIVRELTPAQVFGAAYPRGEAIATAIGNATFDQAESLVEAWRALPNGLEHCEHEEFGAGECSCEETPGSQGTLEAPFDGDDSPLDDRLSHAHGLLNRYAGEYLQGAAGEVWWYRAGQAGVDAATSRFGWRTPDVPDVPGKGVYFAWREAAQQAAWVMTGAALCWRALTQEDRKAWRAVATAVGISAQFPSVVRDLSPEKTAQMTRDLEGPQL